MKLHLFIVPAGLVARARGQDCTDSEPCPLGQFCTYGRGVDDAVAACEPCVAHPDACPLQGLSDAGVLDCAESCAVPMGCSDAEPCPPGFFCNHNDGDGGSGNDSFCELCVSVKDCSGLGLSHPGAEDCEAACGNSIGQTMVAEECSVDSPCSGEGTFCTFEFGDIGTCQDCVLHPHLCFGLSLSSLGEEDCTTSCLLNKYECFDLVLANTTIDEEDYETLGIFGTPLKSASGPLVHCDYWEGSTCEGTEGAVCLMQRNAGLQDESVGVRKVEACERGGGTAVIFYNEEPDFFFGLLFGETNIPSVSMSGTDGQHLLRHKLGSITSVTTFDGGEFCEDSRGCSDALPCPEGWFCNFDYDDEHGFCEYCEDITERFCFYDGLPVRGAEQCEAICGSTSQLRFPDCKFCPNDISSSVVHGKTKCEFCPNNDMIYPKREMRMFGPGVECETVGGFFNRDHHQVDSTDQICELAQMQNHICGCTGPGYVGADTNTKRIVLAWLPRVTALLSLLGSTTIIVHVMRNEYRRERTGNQLMVALSAFDLFGSAAYAFTTLPLPEEDYIYGSKGNAATCSAQGFFIQMGTTSAYINVSLAVYYLFVLTLGWSDRELRKYKKWFFLCPISVGMSFAFAGLPFYDNMVLWCNNSAEIWPEIPMVIAIFLATIIMGVICWHVFREESASNKIRDGGSENGTTTESRILFRLALRRVPDVSENGAFTFSRKVFWQSVWYLMAFYMTWPPYLVLQYLWVSGRAFSLYGFVLYAGTVVPMQGFWNLLVYMYRTRRVVTKKAPAVGVAIGSDEIGPSGAGTSSAAAIDTSSGAFDTSSGANEFSSDGMNSDRSKSRLTAKENED